MAPGSSMLADSCGATQLKEGLSVSSVKGRGLPLIEYNLGQERCKSGARFFFFSFFFLLNDLNKKESAFSKCYLKIFDFKGTKIKKQNCHLDCASEGKVESC